MNSDAANSGTQITVGLAPLCAAWFRDVGLQDDSGQLADSLQADHRAMVRLKSLAYALSKLKILGIPKRRITITFPQSVMLVPRVR